MWRTRFLEHRQAAEPTAGRPPLDGAVDVLSNIDSVTVERHRA